MDLARHWRARAARYRLEGQRHNDGTVRFPPEDDGDTAWQPYRLSGQATLYSFSVVRQPPSGFANQPPYMLALVRLAEGPMITAQLTDCEPETLVIDQPLEMVTRRLRDLGPDGIIIYSYKFRPLLAG